MINPKPLTVTASSPPPPFIVGSPVPVITPSYGGFVPGEGPTSPTLTAFPTCTTSYTVSVPSGPSRTSCSGAVAPNYAITYVPSSFQVIYLWTGFLQPINDTAHQTGVAQSRFKLGQTIPAKFVIQNASGESHHAVRESDVHALG